MSENATSQVQQMTQFFTGMAEAYWTQVAKVQSETIAHTQTAIEESARLAKASLSYANQLGEGWMKVSLDAARRAG